MTATTVAETPGTAGQAPRAVGQGQAFRAVLRRDMYVTGKEFPAFLAQVILQPLFLLFVFGKVLGSLGYTRPGYAHLLFPGLLALTAVITGMQTLAFPLVVANRINIVFSVVFTPLLFTGCSQYPWPSLDTLRWFQVVTALNPMTYVSETMRAALVPAVPHIRPSICLLVLVAAIVVLMRIGVRGFYRRAID